MFTNCSIDARLVKRFIVEVGHSIKLLFPTYTNYVFFPTLNFTPATLMASIRLRPLEEYDSLSISSKVLPGLGRLSCFMKTVLSFDFLILN